MYVTTFYSYKGGVGRTMALVNVAALLAQASTRAWQSLHAGITLQWVAMPESGGLLVCVRGGEPDGDALRDSVAAFLTPQGLDGLIRDLQAIAASLRSSQP